MDWEPKASDPEGREGEEIDTETQSHTLEPAWAPEVSNPCPGPEMIAQETLPSNWVGISY